MNRLISQLKDTPNRLKITPRNLSIVYLDAAFLANRSYFRLMPVGYGDTWQHFWDVYNIYKNDLKAEGLSVKKENDVWVINYKPRNYIHLDESITGFAVLAEK